ncbi:F-type H+-transporting ATPase subunit epsilon [Friedmanniella endophytica]|uniref:ATP synthase epsilon chain n=1 Tax=Microlunatus kandeliicorticis TaxID=1759536 RepID=A0A7W3P724_9ACTN|nr:F0F1 ATP synthase subunit epsilon [Microlunatus kandeliicorticis]MBA8795540.1 F-type H+-transporting ATPase subunit epsilon [Microlunatus kandeliicorticis]
MADPLQVEVVSAEALVWSGEAESVIAKTVDGDIGILPGHSPVLALLVPGGVEIVCPDGRSREIVAVDGGFISVSQDRVSILSEYARMAQELSVADAERELADARAKLDAGDESEETKQHLHRATAQLRAAQKAR